jgi:CHAD domain-containing protein
MLTTTDHSAVPDAAPGTGAAPSFAAVELPPLLREPLNPSWDLGVAAQHIVLTHFGEMLGWRSGVWENREVEAVHQIRVAARRCRTALQTFAALWPDRQARRFGDYVARFADAFGTARDLDVMLLWLEEQLQAADSDRAAAYRWLLERNREKRSAVQPQLERTLLKLEADGFPAAFVAYFSHLPVDLWELEHPIPPEGQNG